MYSWKEFYLETNPCSLAVACEEYLWRVPYSHSCASSSCIATVGTWVSSLPLLLFSAAFFPFSKCLPPKFSPICFWTLLLLSVRGFPGANYLPSFLLPQGCHPSHFSPLVNTVYFCTSFKIYFFCFSSFLRHILDPFLFPGAVHQVVSALAITQHTPIKSSWWGLFLWDRKTEAFRSLSSSVLGWILQGCYLQKVRAFLRVMVK